MQPTAQAVGTVGHDSAPWERKNSWYRGSPEKWKIDYLAPAGETKHQRHSAAEHDGSDQEPFRDGDADEPHHHKSRATMIPADSESTRIIRQGTRVAARVVVLHCPIVLPIHAEFHSKPLAAVTRDSLLATRHP